METIIHELRYAVRALRKTPGFVSIVVLTLALGIGANLAIFGVVNAVVLRPLPFRDAGRLVRVFDDVGGAGARDIGMSAPELVDLQERSGVFDQLSAIFPASTALSGGDRVERIELLGTSPNYFEVLGATAALGRVYTQAEWVPGFLDGVVISDALWKRQFGADRAVIGRRIRVDEDGYTIVGVMPADFRHPGNTVSGDVDIWAATGFVAAPFPSPPVRALRFLPGALGRLKPGLTVKEAQRRLDVMATQLQQAYPNDYPKQLRWSLRIEPAQASMTGNVRPTLVILLAAVGVVLLIVCVNVASLMLARSSARMREFAIRQALGASGGRLARQILTESLLMALAGGAAAVAVLLLAQTSLVALIPSDIPRLAEIQVDWRMVAAALLLSVVTGVLFGLTPALHASAIDPADGLKEGGRSGGGQGVRQGRSRAALVLVEVALSVVLLTSAGLLVRSFAAVLRQNPGLDPRSLITGQIWVPVPNNPQANRYLTPPQQADLARQLLGRLAMIPGVEHAALASSRDIPLVSDGSNPIPFSLPDEATTHDLDHAAKFGSVSAEYFDALKTPIEEGRMFTDHDDATAPNVAIVNEAFVRKFSPQRDVVGQRLRDARGTDFAIVGIVGDVRGNGLDAPPEPHVYRSILQRPSIALAVFLRTRSDVKTTKEALERTVHVVDPELPVFGVRTMAELMSTSMARRRFSLLLMSAFGLSALFLSALGIYGVTAFAVGRRAQEFGVRLALGAEPRDLVKLVFGPGLTLTAAGALAGVVASLAMTRLMSTLLFGVSAIDPTTFVAVPALLVMVALAACVIPARRAARVSPMLALKS